MGGGSIRHVLRYLRRGGGDGTSRARGWHKRESRVLDKSGKGGGGGGGEPAAGRPNAGVAAGDETRGAGTTTTRGRERRAVRRDARTVAWSPSSTPNPIAVSPAGVSTWRRQTWRRRRERGSTRTTSGQTTTTKTTTRQGEENDRGRAVAIARARSQASVSESRLPVTSHDKLARGACAFFRRIRCGPRAGVAGGRGQKRARLVGWPALRGWRSRRRWSRRSSSRWRIGSDGWA